MLSSLSRPVLVSIAVCLLAPLSYAATGRGDGPPPTRSLPPKAWDNETERIFGEDPLQLLRGQRPVIGKRTARPQPGPGGVPPPGTGAFAWSRIVTGDTIVNEIKAYRTDIAANVRSETAFRAGGNRKIRKQFSVIAVMFGIAAQYDGSIRWKDRAAGARDAFARAAANAKAADSNTYKESKTRSGDLDELVRGGSVDFDPPKSEFVWSNVSDRRPLMGRLKEAFEIRIRPWTADKAEFERHRQDIQHEAEILAALAEVIQREEYEFYDDEEYVMHCQQMQAHAQALGRAARENDLEAAQTAAGEVSKRCSVCHEGYK